MGKGLLIGLCFSLLVFGLVLGGLLAWLISRFHRRKLEPSKFSFLVKPLHKTSVLLAIIHGEDQKNHNNKLIIIISPPSPPKKKNTMKEKIWLPM